jgi:hypothetical protein
MDVAVFTGVTVLMEFLILLSRARVAAAVGLTGLPVMKPGELVLRNCDGISGSVVSSVILLPHDGLPPGQGVTRDDSRNNRFGKIR